MSTLFFGGGGWVQGTILMALQEESPEHSVARRSYSQEGGEQYLNCWRTSVNEKGANLVMFGPYAAKNRTCLEDFRIPFGGLACKNSPFPVGQVSEKWCRAGTTPPFKNITYIIGNRDRGVKTYRTLEGGGTCPESCPSKTWTFDPQIDDFLKNLCRKGSISGAPGNSKFSPPL